MLLRVEKSSPDSQECVIVGWRSSSSGRVPAEQAQSLELKPQHHKKKKKEKRKKKNMSLPLLSVKEILL
jgi:hypothetical protein